MAVIPVNSLSLRGSQVVPMLRSALQRSTLPMKSIEFSVENVSRSWREYSMTV